MNEVLEANVESSVPTGGVWGRSSKYGAMEYCIFRSAKDAGEVMRVLMQKQINFRPLMVTLKGYTDVGYICLASHLDGLLSADVVDKERMVIMLSACDKDDKRYASKLWFDRNFTAPIDGYEVKNVDRDTALAADTYIYDPAMKNFFTIEG